MTPTQWLVLLLVAVSLQYGAAAVAYLFNDRPGMALAFVGHVLANAGLVWDAAGTK